MDSCAEDESDDAVIYGRSIKTCTLSLGGQLFIWSMRRWVQASRDKTSISEALASPYRAAKCIAATDVLDELMSLIAAVSYRPVKIRCLPCPTLSSDEWLILHSLQKIQSQEETGAQKLIQEFMVGRLAHTFLESATRYVDLLLCTGNPLIGASYLEVVK